MLASLVSQCSLHSLAVNQVVEVVATGIPAFEKDDDLELIRDALPANIKLLEALLESSPNNAKLLSLLSQMYASYTFAFLEGDLDRPKPVDQKLLKERINRFYQRGMRYGERALVQESKRCAEGLKVLTEMDACLQDLDREAVPSLYWYGFNLAAYMNRNLNSMSALAQGPKMEKAMQRVLELDPGYNFGTGHLFLMLYSGSRSPMMGGNAEKADQHAAAIQKIAGPDFLLAEVYRARYVLVQRQEREAFEKVLKAVLASNPDTSKSPQMGLYNSLAKARAKLYLSSVDELF
jgi:hypothetical protein